MVSLIKRLEERGALTRQDAAVLISQAEADAADARVQAAEILLATAKADAAAARAQAALAQAGSPRAGSPTPALVEPPPAPVIQAPVAMPSTLPVPPPVPQAPVAVAAQSRLGPSDLGDENEGPTTVTATPPASAGPAVGAPGAEAGDGDEDSVRVPYVPEVVKNELRQEVKDDVLAEARRENWGGSHAFPDWVSRFTLYGDVRIRYGLLYNHKTNDDSGNAFPNFNSINTGSPFDLAGAVAEPQYNVDKDRERMQLRARLGATVDLADGFTTGLRLATGNDDSPVSANQTLGAAGSGQGGDFSKYSVWLDRAYIRYQTGGDPATDISLTAGRFENPFFATSLIWANDLSFDGVVASVPLKVHWDGNVVDSIKPFLVAGVFPVFNTDLNFATDNAAKFPSYDKWLDAAQAGVDWRTSNDFDIKVAAAYYYFKNMQGQLSTPFTPLNSSNAGSTDASRPSFAQNGNTYMEVRDIVPGPLNDNGTIDQFQYFGLATPFHEFAATGRIEYNHFEPFQVSLTGEFVENTAFRETSVSAMAINNLGAVPSSGGTAPFLGGNKGWITTLKFGDAVLQRAGDWNLGIGYRYLQSDAVVDAFTDSDFGGDLPGTNLEGYTIDGSLSLGHGVWFETKYFAASAIAGPSYKNDYLQLDLNTKF